MCFCGACDRIIIGRRGRQKNKMLKLHYVPIGNNQCSFITSHSNELNASAPTKSISICFMRRCLRGPNLQRSLLNRVGMCSNRKRLFSWCCGGDAAFGKDYQNILDYPHARCPFCRKRQNRDSATPRPTFLYSCPLLFAQTAPLSKPSPHEAYGLGFRRDTRFMA